MATNQDFDDLIQRIDTATETLEENVITLTEGAGDLAQAVEDAENAAQEAGGYVSTIEGMITDLENAVIIEEAPKDGKEYARKDGDWVETTGGGPGTVQSVNGETPDGSGDVTITAADITGFATVATTGDYNDLDNTPSIPSFGTVASRDVVTGNADTTTTSIPTVSWVNAKNYGDVQLGSPAPVTNGLAVWQFDGAKLLRQYNQSSGDEFVRVNASGAVSSRTYAEVKSDLGLGTAAEQDVVVDNDDTTATSIPTVGWVQANAGGGVPAVIGGGTAAQYAAQTFIYDVATMENRAANTGDTVFADAVDVFNNFGRRFPVCFTNNNDATNGPTPWYEDGINPIAITWGTMEIVPSFGNSNMTSVTYIWVYATIHTRSTVAYGKRYMRRMRPTGAWYDANWKLIPAVVD